MGLGSFVKKAAGVASGFGGILGDDRDPATAASSVSGYASLPEELQEFGRDRLIPDLISQYDLPRPSYPFRRLEHSDIEDPLFASRALIGLQKYKDYLASPKGEEEAGQEGAGAPVSNDTIDELFGRMMINQMAGGAHTKLTGPYKQLQRQGTAQEFQKIGQEVRGGARQGGGLRSSGIVNEDGTFNQAIADVLNNRRRGLATYG